MKKLIILTLLLMLSHHAWATDSCKLMNIDITNNTQYEWDLVSYEKKAGKLNTDEEDFETIPAGDTISIQIQDGNNGAWYKFTYEVAQNTNYNIVLKFKKEKCSKGTCNNISNNSEVQSTTWYTYTKNFSNGYSGCAWSNQDDTDSHVCLNIPLSTQLRITMPDYDDPLRSSAIMRQTIAAQDPQLLTEFDHVYNEPLAIKNGNRRFVYVYTCTSEGCADKYNYSHNDNNC